jgi:tryptophan synthase alpha chain
VSGRIGAAFAAAARAGRPAFIPYVTAGDPSLEATSRIVGALQRAGADLVEIGVPFSDPIADGPVIQRAAERALRGGATLSATLDLVRDLKRSGAPPLVLFTYYNPIHRMGLEPFAARAREAELDGLLVTDLPPEEAGALHAALRQGPIERIGFLAPNSSPERMRAIAGRSSGFLYLISRAGVTGVRDDLPAGALEQIGAARDVAGGLPIAIGFGISRPEQIRALTGVADGIVVGSALVRVIEEAGDAGDLPDRVERFCRHLIASAP